MLASSSGATLFAFSIGMSSVALPLLALAAGYSAAGVGALTAVSAIAQMVTRMVLGVAMRRWPDRYLVTAAALLLAASHGLVALSAAAVPFVLAELVQGVARAAFWTGSQTHVVRGNGTSVGALAVVNFSSSIGLLGGPILAGVMSERTPVLALWVAAVIALLGVAPSLLLDRLPPFVPPTHRPPGRLWRRPGVSNGCWAGVTAGAWRGLLSSFIPVALAAARQSASTIGVLVTVANGASVIGPLLVARVSSAGAPWVFAAGTLAAGVGTGATALVADDVLLSAVALAVSGLGAGALQTLGPAMATDAVHPQERGDAIAVAGTFRAAALFAAPMGVVGLVGLVSLGSAMAIAGAALALPVLTVRSLAAHTRRT